MKLRALRGLWDDVLGAACVVEDVVSTLRNHRLTKAETKQLTASERSSALAEARQGCTHTPTCPPSSAPGRTAAAEIWSDDSCVYLCNGLVLSTKETPRAPDSPSSLCTPTPQKESVS
ncbi:hypothetical protein [Streptomyces sp. PsTaAH-124]|uniref:hypothetical protein n=1 Tax=Streptomyces sp. PsTaAH-124 TaxID=1157638 RepID=UPI000370BDF0|nr:hypothetical protein [Streptomyces sp. PsTaAH-124]